MKIHYRGDFGTQILQAFSGISVALERGLTPELVFNCLDEERNRYQDYVSKLFDSSKIRISDQSGREKFQYWEHGVASSSVKYMPQVRNLLNRFDKPDNISKAIFVYAFSHGDQCLEQDINLNKKLLDYSFLFHDEIHLIGNSDVLCNHLYKLYSKKYSGLKYKTSLTLEQQWLYIINSSCIYSKPNPFVCAAALYEPTLELKLSNFLDHRCYQFDKNEYLYAFEQKKCNSLISILPALDTIHDLDRPLASNQKYISSLTTHDYFLKSESQHNCAQFSQSVAKLLASLPSDIKNIYVSKLNGCKHLEIDSIGEIVESIFYFLESILDENNIKSSSKDHYLTSLRNILLSSTKSFGSESYPPILEEAGFSLTKHFLFNYFYLLNRSYLLDANKLSNYIKELEFFLSNGYLIINNFLAEGELSMLRDLFQSSNGSLSKNKSTLMSVNNDTLPLIKKLTSAEFLEFLSLMTGYAPKIIKEEIINNTFMQSVRIKKGLSGNDPQQNFHLDTFYPAFKFWLFPYDVSLDSGPFEYVPGSHLPYKAVYKHLRKGYLSNAYNTDYAISSDHTEGSLRATTQDITRMGLNSRRFGVQANSLVIANVGGFHRRSIARETVVRHAVHSSIRPKMIFDPSTYHSI